MKFEPGFKKITLLKRYKRFLADVESNGETFTVHCPNTGSMKNCVVEGSPGWVSDSNNPKRKYRYTWEIATTPAGALACVNTHRANSLVVEAIENGVIEELEGYETLQTEKKYGSEGSRIDILLSSGEQQCFVEVKNVTLEAKNGLGLFPDAVSDRASKHLRELIEVRENGHRAVLLFCVSHTGINAVSPADQIDPKYGETLREAVKKGVEVFAYKASITPNEIVLTSSIPVVL